MPGEDPLPSFKQRRCWSGLPAGVDDVRCLPPSSVVAAENSRARRRARRAGSGGVGGSRGTEVGFSAPLGFRINDLLRRSTLRLCFAGAPSFPAPCLSCLHFLSRTSLLLAFPFADPCLTSPAPPPTSAVVYYFLLPLLPSPCIVSLLFSLSVILLVFIFAVSLF